MLHRQSVDAGEPRRISIPLQRAALRGRGHIFGESCGRIFAGGLLPFFMAPHTGSPTIFFGTMLLFAAIGAVVPIVWGKETVGQIELVTETVPELA